MATKHYIVILGVCFLAFFSSCKNESSDKGLYEVDSLKTDIETVKKARSIFYRMYLPSEMYKVFEKAGAVYDPNILNPVENVNMYEVSSKAALNLGVYGVDLSYNKMFGQNQRTLLYFAVIHKLSQQMGIPDNQFANALKKMEKNIANRDSLTKYATDIYSSTNKFLNENDREAMAALILTGGWVEAIYISTSIADQNVNNQEIIERIAFQKYSLRSLISLLNVYQSDPSVTKYVLMLKALNRAFDKFEIYYELNDLNIDTINKLISSNKVEVNLQADNVAEIKKLIRQIREDIVK